ncbi:MAG: hypothetical protein KDA87_26110 [Planctomycetales bacterium]|nr:hypothetical protein [Planctomycetales bacterium]
MKDSDLHSRKPLLRRQRIVLLTGAAMVGSYYVLRAIPWTLETGAALGITLALAACGLLTVAFAAISSRRQRITCLVITSLLVLAVFVWLTPNFRRASLQRQLRILGAKVTSETDAGDGVWFQYRGFYLPCWIRDQLGDAFFGPIDEVNFSNRDVPLDEIMKLDFDDPIATLNLSFADVSNDDLVRLTQIIDARQVLLNSLPVDAETLNAFGQMGSLSHIAAIDTNVSPTDATDFVVRHPRVNLVHGDFTNGYGFVRVPITEQ